MLRCRLDVISFRKEAGRGCPTGILRPIYCFIFEQSTKPRSTTWEQAMRDMIKKMSNVPQAGYMTTQSVAY